MWYLIGQIILCLFVAFVLGALLAWWMYRSTARQREQELSERLSRMERDLANASAQSSAAQERSRQLGEQLLAQKVETERAADGLAAKAAALGELETRHAEVRAVQQRMEAAAAKSHDEIETLKTKLADRDQHVGDLEHDLSRIGKTKDEEITKLRERLASLEGDRAQWEQESEQSRRRMSDLEHTVRERDTRITELESLRADLDRCTAEMDRASTEFRTTIERRDAEIAELQRQLADRPPHPATRPATPPRPAPALAKGPAKDDLKRIKGIGRVLERLLHRNGIHTFRQIASWTPQDVEQIDEKLEAFRGRITRDDWINQARRLADEQ